MAKLEFCTCNHGKIPASSGFGQEQCPRCDGHGKIITRDPLPMLLSDWWTYHHQECRPHRYNGNDLLGCSKTGCPAKTYEQTGVWTGPRIRYWWYALHNLVAHPLLILCPPLGDILHRRTGDRMEW